MNGEKTGSRRLLELWSSTVLQQAVGLEQRNDSHNKRDVEADHRSDSHLFLRLLFACVHSQVFAVCSHVHGELQEKRRFCADTCRKTDILEADCQAAEPQTDRQTGHEDHSSLKHLAHTLM